MGDYEALMAAVRDNPADDLSRLAVADWFSDNGQDRRGEFIRGQIAGRLQTLSLTSLIPYESFFGCQPHQMGMCAEAGTAWADANGRRLIYRRGFVHTVRGPLAAFWEERECNRCDGDGSSRKGNGHRWECPDCNSGRISRPTEFFRTLVRREPVEVVEVTDREPLRVRVRDGSKGEIQGFGWLWDTDIQGNRFDFERLMRNALPHKIYAMSRSRSGRSYLFSQEAAKALSNALITLARQP